MEDQLEGGAACLQRGEGHRRSEALLTVTQGNKNNYFFPSTFRAAAEKSGIQVNFLNRCESGAGEMAGFPGDLGSTPTTHIEAHNPL